MTDCCAGAPCLIRAANLQTTVPKTFSIPAVRAIANAPQKITRAVAPQYMHACTCAPIASRRSIKPKERTALALTIGLSSIGLLERAYRGMKAKLSATAGARCLRNTSTATRFRRRIVHQRATAMAMDIGGAQQASAVLAGRMRDLATTRSRR